MGRSKEAEEGDEGEENNAEDGGRRRDLLAMRPSVPKLVNALGEYFPKPERRPTVSA
jgi:hypothetical protein